MTLLKIARLGHPILLAKAPPVADVRDHECQRLVDDMIETMLDAPGIGLAAPQVHRSLRLVVALPVGGREEIEGATPLVLVNPVLEPVGDAVETDIEGCLSIPEIRGLVPRARTVDWRALDRHGNPIEGRAEGLFARILQHEVDHLDGILFPMRMTDLRHLAMTSELPHLMAMARPTSEGRR
jgi:peptide deformylase